MPAPVSTPATRRLLWGLAGALAGWGIYLAIGATGIFTDVGLFDLRRSLIVLFCSGTFVGFWAWILTHRSGSTDTELRNWPSLVSLLVTCAAYLCWAAAWWAYRTAPDSPWTFVWGGVSTITFGIAAIAALVGLSDPRRVQGKLLGLLTLGLLLVAAVAFIVQVRHFTAPRRPQARSLQRQLGSPISRGTSRPDHVRQPLG